MKKKANAKIKFEEKVLENKKARNQKKLESHLALADARIEDALDDADLAVAVLSNEVELAIENNGEDADFILFKAENILEEILLRTQLRIQVAKNELIANLQEDLDDTIETINYEESIAEFKDKTATVVTTLEGKIATEKEEFEQKYAK
ncbi:hypothetical protein [uncultured Methanobrevibacter sp.]|uniref:hypothetical protein n=1 Tax=uncultured Methanobrevibacter sp. TaxID=253161 RepID=UPI0025F86C9D|nr:hypothetical protein [uncultured Methanobrevibacter sp.]